jgi:hypothetical protein
LSVRKLFPLSTNVIAFPAVNPDTVTPMVKVAGWTAGVSVTVIVSLIVGIVTVNEGGAGADMLLPAPFNGIVWTKFGLTAVLVTLLKAALSVNVMAPFGGVPDGAR